MAVRVFCPTPSDLLKKIKNDVESKRISTWAVDTDGDFTHSPEQWKLKAWMRPRLLENQIKFSFLSSKRIVTTKELYGIYHGRFIEMLLLHYDTEFDRVSASALPVAGDIVYSSSSSD